MVKITSFCSAQNAVTPDVPNCKPRICFAFVSRCSWLVVLVANRRSVKTRLNYQQQRVILPRDNKNSERLGYSTCVSVVVEN